MCLPDLRAAPLDDDRAGLGSAADADALKGEVFGGSVVVGVDRGEAQNVERQSENSFCRGHLREILRRAYGGVDESVGNGVIAVSLAGSATH